jgi:Ca-activated chloride channel family protein
VTALYEIVPAGSSSDVEIRGTDALRYQPEPAPRTTNGDELAFVRLRYKAPDGDASQLIEVPVRNRETRATADFTFSAAVASFGMLLRQSPHSGTATFESVAALAHDGMGDDRGGYRRGFLELVERAAEISRRIASGAER